MTAATDPAARFAALSGLSISPHQRETLSDLLTDADAATLRHLAAAGMGANTLRALASDLHYLERWCLAALGQPLPWPAPPELVMKFIAQHLWDAARRESDPSHGMPDAVMAALRLSGALRSPGPHAPSTVKRRLSLWGSLHRWRGLEGPFGDGRIRQSLRLAVRAAARPRGRKSELAVTADIVEKLLRTCWLNRLIDLRDRAIILVAFSSGGRRRSEIAGLRVEDIVAAPDVAGEGEATPLPARKLRLGRTKTTDADDDAVSWLIGKPVAALDAWLQAAKIGKGAVFRAVDQWGNLGEAGLTPQAINLILKKRVALAGLDPALYSAHGLRSGFLTEAARQGVPLTEAMAQSQHRSVQQAARYYNDSERRMGRAARLLG